MKIATCVAGALFLVGAAQAEEKTLKAEVKTETATVAAGTAGFSSHVCQSGANTRRVVLTGEVPCEVHYKKETEQPGHDQVLWTAKNDKKYCESKAQEFVDKLSGMGWTCSKQ